MEEFKGYPVENSYPEDGWLKGYFFAVKEDLLNIPDHNGKAYRDIGYIKHKDFLLHLLDVRANEKILDLGCSDGAMAVYCGLMGAEVYGVDISTQSIEKVNRNFRKYSIKGKAIVADARNTGFKDNFFDKIVSSDFFEHLNRQDSVLALGEARRILKPGGVMVIKTPNLLYLKLSKLFKQLCALFSLKNPFSVVVPHTRGSAPEHIGLKTRLGMEAIIRDAGFLNFNFRYDVHSRFRNRHYLLKTLLTENLLLRDFFAEDLIAVIYKPIILSYFP